ncbi:MAG: hypothetical protein BGO55_06195 [Sphingobacteriales bacterium 50-39]|nr:hypothetical protein [Sphingobacteriales bacterium]OJW52854.1 MAG: hypothetical protein BGO55_06195 [Sphingobacteriales bacterium 50-39]
MRRIFLWGLRMWLATVSCQQSTTKDNSAFLPGIYVNQTETEFCRVADTFIIRRLTLQGESYQVSRRSSFQRIRQGIKLPSEYQAEQWTGVYEAQSKILRATDKGKLLQYEPSENQVYNGNVVYEKVE